jgi:hypothetical protein
MDAVTFQICNHLGIMDKVPKDLDLASLREGRNFVNGPLYTETETLAGFGQDDLHDSL